MNGGGSRVDGRQSTVHGPQSTVCLGATVGQIIYLLSSDFLRLVFLAVLLAIPIAYIGMSRWLDHFAYHVPLSWLIFFAAAFVAVIIAVLSVGYQSLKAAVADPAESIRYE